MAMEHRCGTRRAIDAGIIVDCRPAGLVRGRVRNISVGGLYVKMRPMPGLASDQVTVIFVRRESGVSRVYRLPALVLRWTREGAGLMFTELTSNSFYALLAMLLAEERRGAGTRGGERSGGPQRRPGGSWFKK